MFAIEVLIVILVLSLLALTVVTQIMVPIAEDRPWFPALRKTTKVLDSAVLEINAQTDEALKENELAKMQQRLEKTRNKKAV